MHGHSNATFWMLESTIMPTTVSEEVHVIIQSTSGWVSQWTLFFGARKNTVFMGFAVRFSFCLEGDSAAMRMAF
jgi:hypothetical protein